MNEKISQIKKVIRQFQQVTHKLSRIEELPIFVSDDVEISTCEAHTIQVIGEHDQICVRDVATHFGVTKSAASQLISKLSKKNFLKKQKSAHSNKELQLSLTPLGWQAFHAHEQAHGKDMSRVIESMLPFSPTEIATLTTLLKTISDITDERLQD